MRFVSLLCVVLIGWVMPAHSLSAQDMNHTVYPFTVQDIHGQDVSLEHYKGKVLLIVNVASECGYTPQYASLQLLHEELGDKGLVVMGFPANDFGAQEPGSNTEILNFCSTQFGVTFPMFSKVTVKGEGQHPLYTFLTTRELNGMMDADMKWNFQKFLISREGRLLKVINPGVSVDDKEVRSAIEAALK